MATSDSQKYCFTRTERTSYNQKRKHNIQKFICMIDEANKKNSNLSFKPVTKENKQSFVNTEKNRLVLYKTSHNESICIQFPGKEGGRNEPKPYDFKPLIINEKGTEIKDMQIYHMLEALEQISNNHLLDYFAHILFRICFLTLHSMETELYTLIKSDTVNDVIIHTFESSTNLNGSTLSLKWNKLQLSVDETLADASKEALSQIMRSTHTLHYTTNDGQIEKDQSFSIEAFLYFLDLFMLNEDIKYNYNAPSLCRNGRQGTHDIFFGFILSKLARMRLTSYLQGITIGRGVITLKNSDYTKISGLDVE